ncbi:MAG: LURP-one-related family protein [Clostridia bacterium]|nr:LURP-one-related family protein [Clostridia bacterium]
MQYFIQQKILTFFRKKYEIQNSEGEIIYQVKSNIWFPFKLTVSDLNNKPLIVIKKRYFRIFPRFDVYSTESKTMLAKIKAKLGILEKRFNIYSSNPEFNNLKIHGDVIGLSFQIMKDNEVLATVNKKILNIGDKYSVQINDDKNSMLYFAIVLTLDTIVHTRKKR